MAKKRKQERAEATFRGFRSVLARFLPESQVSQAKVTIYRGNKKKKKNFFLFFFLYIEVVLNLGFWERYNNR